MPTPLLRLSLLPRPGPLTHLLPRAFHTTPSLPSFSRSPTARDAARRLRHRGPPERELWPLDLLKAAHAPGGAGLDITPSRAVQVLEEFSALGQKNLGKEDVPRFLREHALRPHTLTQLAKILLQTQHERDYPVVRDLLLAASTQQDAAATLFLINHAISTSRLNALSLAPARAHLRQLVAASHPTAMVLQAAVYTQEGARADTAMTARLRGQAIELCERVVALEAGAAKAGERRERLDEAQGKAWSMLASLRSYGAQTKEAERALERAAWGHDDAGAYYNLARYYRRPDHPEYVAFMTKAAASGVAGAAHQLGKFYAGRAWPGLGLGGGELVSGTKGPADAVEEGKALPPAPTGDTQQERRLAREWFYVSVEVPDHENVDESLVYLALLLREEGERSQGEAFLDNAKDFGTHGKVAAPWLLERWDSDADFVTMIQGLEKATKHSPPRP